MNELFDRITEIIASPHTTITDHDKERAVKILSEIAQHIRITTQEKNYFYSRYFTAHVENYLRETYEVYFTD
jgi:hypothetical protein